LPLIYYDIIVDFQKLNSNKSEKNNDKKVWGKIIEQIILHCYITNYYGYLSQNKLN
jgi:hypothetical protein